MIKQFKTAYEEREWRAARALIWCALEGTEIADAQADLFRIHDLHGIGTDEDEAAILGIMERLACSHAREYLEGGAWSWDDAERHNVLLLLRHLRETGQIHPELVNRLRLDF